MPQPNAYRDGDARGLEQAARELLDGVPIAPAPRGRSGGAHEPLEVELAATLLYWAQPLSLSPGAGHGCGSAAKPRVNEIIDLGLRHRGRHDEALRAFHAGAALRFDILMDIGGFRDMHRHRRCVQIMQGFTALHGYETPRGVWQTAGLRGTV